MPALALDNIIFRNLASTQRWGDMKLLWKGCLLGSGAVVRRLGADSWGLSLGKVPRADAIAVWPLRRLVPLQQNALSTGWTI